MCSLNCAIYFPLLGYTKYGNNNKQRKNKQIFQGAPLRPASWVLGFKETKSATMNIFRIFLFSF